MNPLQRVFKGRRILVTGDTGFKGSWLSLWLHALGAEVTGLALPPENDDAHYHLLGLSSLIRHMDADVRDQAQVKAVFDDARPEILFHLAAQAIVRTSYREPKATFDTNVGGGVNILEAVRQSGSLRSVVFITSDKCYRNNEWTRGYTEDDVLGGRDPYSASKAAAEIVFAAYQDSFFMQKKGMGAATARAGNVMGGGDWARDRIIPDCVRSLKSGAVVTVRNPASTRPWQHVLEPLSGYLTLAAKLLEDPASFAGAYNFGPKAGSIKTVRDVVEGSIRAWGRGEYAVATELHAPHEAGLLHLDCEKAGRELGWQPLWDFDRTIIETMAWYKAVSDGKPALAMSRQQINNYMAERYD
ncbi:MAG: CDP-glucose 4,6-dehydratase [Candidatus Omnitrophota bacterium]